MARTRHQEAGEEWSCPLCTLLNTAEDDRCAACDNARPLVHKIRKSQPSEPSTAVAAASEVQHTYRPSTGVFFSSLPSDQRDLGTTTAWRQEPRLVVNRRRGISRRNVSTDRERKVESETIATDVTGQYTGSTTTRRDREQEIIVAAEVESTTDNVEPMVTTENEEERQEDEEDASVEEPCFNLLGSGASVFAAPVVQTIVENQCTTDETKSRNDSDADDEVVVSSPPRYPGFMLASKVQIEETKIEEKLANAGLDLSDSEEEDKEPKQLRRQTGEKDESWEDKWVCQICTNLNDQTVMECSSCSYKRYRDNSHSTDTEAGSSLRWACNTCTSLNPPEVTDCLMCLSKRNVDAATSNGVSNERWKCSLCTTFNVPCATRCEVCDRSREDEPKKAAGKGRQCPVCTNINSPGSTRCELCDSSLHTDEEVPGDHFVDLSSSPLGRTSSYAVYDGDLENPYADLSQYNDYDVPNEVADADSDFVEEISDNEQPSMSLTNSRPLRVRSELKEFEHFVCMEDLRSDYECRIDYSKMFAGQRSRKSYADRHATRQTESRKRKRAAARKEAGGANPTSRGGKTSKGGKKRKAAGGTRRASAGGAKAPRGKRAKKTGTSARRASSATTYSSGVNHYDDSTADFGENLNTMAWEGVGSAGYL